MRCHPVSFASWQQQRILRADQTVSPVRAIDLAHFLPGAPVIEGRLISSVVFHSIDGQEQVLTREGPDSLFDPQGSIESIQFIYSETEQSPKNLPTALPD
jgi:hypothetical protein